MRKIQLIPLSKNEEARKYLNNYLTELSEFDTSVCFDENGTPIYKWFDCYFEEKSRYPFYLKVDNNVAGLALIREIGDRAFEIAEFYVLPKYRKDGNALWFATALTDMFDGSFEFSTRLKNKRAVKFWSKFISSINPSSFYDDEECRNWEIR